MNAFALFLFYLLVGGCVGGKDDEYEKVSFFTNDENGPWISLLNFKAVLGIPRRKFPDLRLKVTLTTIEEASRRDEHGQTLKKVERPPTIIEEHTEEDSYDVETHHVPDETTTHEQVEDIGKKVVENEEVVEEHEGSAREADTEQAEAIDVDDEDSVVEGSAEALRRMLPIDEWQGKEEQLDHPPETISQFFDVNQTSKIEEEIVFKKNVYPEILHKPEKEKTPEHLEQSHQLPKQKSKLTTTKVASIDTKLFERELMSMKVRDEQVEMIRAMLTNSTRLEEETGEGHRDLGGSYVIPLLSAIQYDNNTVPLLFSDIPVNVLVQLNILYVGSFDSLLMEYTMDAEMNMRWYDLRLANNYTKPIRIREKEIIDKIWRPDPYFVNSKYSYFHRVSFPNFRMIITPQGLVSYTMRVTLLPSCPMIFCRYPHDRQECDLRLSSIAYPRSLILFSWHSLSFSLPPHVGLAELNATSIRTSNCSVEGKLIHSSCLRLVVELKREGGRFVVEKYIPSALAMMFGWVAPYVPYNYEEVRIVTPITVLLTLVQMEKGDQEVRTSYLTSLDIWFAMMKAFTVVSLIESIAVLALIKRGRAMERLAERAVNEFERASMETQRRNMHRAVLRLDYLARVLSPIAFMAFLFYYLLVITQGTEDECIAKPFNGIESGTVYPL